MATTPSWKAADNGLPNNRDAVNHADQVNQLLGTHGVTVVNTGTNIVTPLGGQRSTSLTDHSSPFWDLSQRFTMPGGSSTVGRVTIPVQVVGKGAPFTVSLYPDNGSNAPNTSNLLASTYVPAPWLTAIAAPNGLATGGPLASAKYNGYIGTNFQNLTPWTAPAGGPAGGGLQNSSITTSGNYLIFAGGYTGTAPTANVSTVQYLGGSTIGNPVAQPALPIGTFTNAVTATSGGSLVVAGGVTGASTNTAAVWVASWNVNTGQVGTWSSQTALPVVIKDASATSSGNFVYVIGGNSAGTILNTVYMATVNNGQIQSWTAETNLPVTLQKPAVAVLQGYLIVAGGGTDNSGTTSSATYFSKINSDGSLGAWQTGPTMPVGVSSFYSGWDYVVTDTALVTIGGVTGLGPTATNRLQILSVDANGPSDHWDTETWGNPNVYLVSAFPASNGAWEVMDIRIGTSQYQSFQLTPVLRMSVPLPTTSLTPGSVYHVVFQQQQLQASQVNSTTNDATYVYQTDTGALPFDMLISARNANSWSVFNIGYSIAMTVYDLSGTGTLWHTWEDPTVTSSGFSSNIATRNTSIFYNRLGLPYGLFESTLQPNDPLNANPTFTSGVSSWTPHNSTFVQSNAQVHGGFAFSGLFTPNGVAVAPNVTSDLAPVTPVSQIVQSSRWQMVNGWFYSPTGTSNVALGIDWYDRNSTFISTSSVTSTLPAATWTNLSNLFNVPVTASFASINFTESGTPSVSNTVYFSNVTLTLSNELATSLAGADQVVYSNGIWPPIMVNQVA